MITALDTTILVDIFGADQSFGPASREALRQCAADGALVSCAAVWAEVTSVFPTCEEAQATFHRLAVRFDATTQATAMQAGDMWRRYRKNGGPRTRVAADFLIGAHALQQADRLLTRDGGFYRTYFQDLAIVDPSAP